MKYHVAEIFSSINGEGTRAGELAVFVRLTGCNLSCTYCDTSWANCENAGFTAMTADEILDAVKKTGIKNVTLTGGEPLLSEGVRELIQLLCVNDFSVEIETNGSIYLAPFSEISPRPLFTMDYKLPVSGMEKHMDHRNFELLEKNDTVKLVAGSINDMKRGLDIIEKYDLTNKCHVYFSPVFGSVDPADMVDFMKENRLNGVRLQLQLHKFIWDPQERGV